MQRLACRLPAATLCLAVLAGQAWATGAGSGDFDWVGLGAVRPAQVFSDDFDGDLLDRSKWCTRYQHAGGPALQIADPQCLKFGAFGTLDFLNQEQQRYVDINRRGLALHRVRDGVLHLTATKTLDDPYVRFESSMIRSKVEFRPTDSTSLLMQARVRLPAVKGTWPAFWISPGVDEKQQTAWPPEIDMMEGALNTSTDPASSVKLGAQAQNWGGKGVSEKPTTLTFVGKGFDASTRRFRRAGSMRGVWIEFALLWTTESACYFIDRVKVACEAYQWVDNDRRPAPAAPVMLNLGIGGAWAGADGMDDAAFPTSFDVDWVRVHEFRRPR